MKTASSLIVALLIISPFLFTSRASALIAYVDAGNNDYRIASITDLDIGGSLYNVTFHDASDFASGPSSQNWTDYLVNSGVTDPITFTTLASAQTAMSAVRAAIFAEGIDASMAIDSHFFLSLPYEDTGASIRRLIATRSGLNPLAYNSAISNVNTGYTSNFGTTTAFLEFDTATVPEPGTTVPLGIVLAAAAWRTRKSRRRRPGAH